MTRLISLKRPESALRPTQLTKPKPKPVAMLKVSGMLMMVKKAGKATVKSLNLMRPTSCIIMAPTMISTGAVA